MNIKVLSGADLARCFGVDRSMVTRWKKAGMPETKGVFSLPECIKWRLEREADAMAPKTSASTEGEKWLTAFRRERAITARLERRKVQGSLISKSDVSSEWVKRLLELRQGLLTLPVRLPPVLEGKDVDAMRPIIKDILYKMMESYARTGQFTPTKNNEGETGHADNAKKESRHDTIQSSSTDRKKTSRKNSKPGKNPANSRKSR
ncbi:MAG: hypothetical protein HQM09_07835 [Candidatus Riflebacteria bacterium]|nr:hypothetical protein [Candidatus Riflebacteria bacterium]